MSEADFSRIVNHVLLPAAGTYEIDPVHSFIGFSAQHLVVGRVRGRFDGVTGRAVIAAEPLQSSVEVSIESATINTSMPMRDKDLRSAQYLDSDRFPTITFHSTRVNNTPGAWLLAGEVTVRDQRVPVELLVRFGGSIGDPFGNARVAFHAEGAVTRSALGLTTELAKESGGHTVGQDIKLTIDAELIRPL